MAEHENQLNQFLEEGIITLGHVQITDESRSEISPDEEKIIIAEIRMTTLSPSHRQTYGSTRFMLWDDSSLEIIVEGKSSPFCDLGDVETLEFVLRAFRAKLARLNPSISEDQAQL